MPYISLDDLKLFQFECLPFLSQSFHFLTFSGFVASKGSSLISKGSSLMSKGSSLMSKGSAFISGESIFSSLELEVLFDFYCLIAIHFDNFYFFFYAINVSSNFNFTYKGGDKLSDFDASMFPRIQSLGRISDRSSQLEIGPTIIFYLGEIFDRLSFGWDKSEVCKFREFDALELGLQVKIIALDMQNFQFLPTCQNAWILTISKICWTFLKESISSLGPMLSSFSMLLQCQVSEI